MKKEKEGFLMNLKRYKIITSYELQRKKDIECYDKIMESHQNYVYIFYNYIIKFKEKLNTFISTKIL
jgi:hypothetical protein